METMNSVYLDLLIDSMKKKEDLLEQIILATMQQMSCIKESELKEELYEAIFEKKNGLIQEIEQLDEGFEQLYQRVQQEILGHKEAYKEQILSLQHLIRSVTDKGMQVQRLEQENRQRLEQYIAGQRRHIKEYKVSKKTATSYYHNMMKQANTQSFLYDRKN